MPAKRKSGRPKKATPKKSAARKRAAPVRSLTDALAGAAWAEADIALAQALADLDEVESAADAATRADAFAMLAQSLSSAGRKRGLTRIGDLGVRAVFDAARHDLNISVAKAPKNVRIAARGVARGGNVLVKPRVHPDRRTKRS
jgi:hypothetical protein